MPPFSCAVEGLTDQLHQQGASALIGRAVYFVGIGGCGVSGLAKMLAAPGGRGALCSGSDKVACDLTDELQQAGIAVSFDQESGSLPARCDLVIASAAISTDHPQLAAARKRQIPVISYAEALGIMQLDRTGVSIAGTHGKSTTVSMLSHVLIQTGLDPSVIVGATCPQIGGGSRIGSNAIPIGPRAGEPGILVAEACEFNRSFHHHRPQIGLINNIEEDHLDIYGSLEAIIEAFAGFARLIPSAPEGGKLLIADDGAHRREITAGLSCEVHTIGFAPTSNYQVMYDPNEGSAGVAQNGRRLAHWSNHMPGDHIAFDSAAAAVLAHWLGADWPDIARALSGFRGVDRRMQKLGSRPVAGGSVTVYDDYGHHPTEIDRTLRALRAAERPQRLICVFQPHQHSRTRFLLDQFAQSFSSADVVIVPHIYFVRDSEIEKQKVSAADLVDRLRERGLTAMHLYPFEAIVEQLEVMCRAGDLVVIMGAGPVWQVARDFLRTRSVPCDNHAGIAHASPID